MKKTYAKDRKKCRVTFELPAEVNAKTVTLTGDFNDWDQNKHPLKKRKDGHFSTTLTLEAGKEYRFRYLIDGSRWENDWHADQYVPNDMGTEDSVVHV